MKPIRPNIYGAELKIYELIHSIFYVLLINLNDRFPVVQNNIFIMKNVTDYVQTN